MNVQISDAAYDRMKKPIVLNAYHYAWLQLHPERTEEWLKIHLADGFDVHHIDGNRENNDPSNLCLIEYKDHNRLHGFPEKFTSRNTTRRSSPDLDAQCYALRLSGLSWRAVSKKAELKDSWGSNAAQAAKRHCIRHQLDWPIKPLI